MITPARLRLALAGVAASALLAACVSAPPVATVTASPAASPAPSASAAPSPSPTPTCTDATVSFQPVASSTYATEINSRGYLLVGVSADTRLLGAVDPQQPAVFQGFDIDMARLVAKAVTGSPDKIRFKVITTADRIKQLSTPVDLKDNANGGVDLVARAFTMNCSRWNEIYFSAVYLNAAQRWMVLKDSGLDTLDKLSGKKVCAPKGSTSLTNITDKNSKVEVVGVTSHTDCLVALQQGTVDAITGDDAILAGFSAQDPSTEVVVKGEPLEPEPYGLGVNGKRKDFAAYVNGVLDKARADGTWQASYDKWLKPYLGTRTPPRPEYGRT